MLWAYEEYKWQQNANNSSTLQRLVYFQTGIDIFKQNPIMGVGTGDILQAYKNEYAENDRGLEKRFQNISHNQFLTIAVTLGIVGLMFFFVSVFYPFWLYRSDMLYGVFTCLMLVSFMTDNTFDRQAGVTLFAFFNALLIVRRELSET
jgi:O-antigen ligase